MNLEIRNRQKLSQILIEARRIGDVQTILNLLQKLVNALVANPISAVSMKDYCNLLDILMNHIQHPDQFFPKTNMQFFDGNPKKCFEKEMVTDILLELENLLF